MYKIILAAALLPFAAAKSVGDCQCRPKTCTPSEGDAAGSTVYYAGDCSLLYNGNPWCWTEGECGTAPLLGTTQTCDGAHLAFCNGYLPDAYNGFVAGTAVPFVDAVKVVLDVPENFVAGVEQSIFIRVEDADGNLATDVNTKIKIAAVGSESGSGLTRFRVGGDDSTFKWYGGFVADVNASTAVIHVAHDQSEAVTFSLSDSSETGLDFTEGEKSMTVVAAETSFLELVSDFELESDTMIEEVDRSVSFHFVPKDSYGNIVLSEDRDIRLVSDPNLELIGTVPSALVDIKLLPIANGKSETLFVKSVVAGLYDLDFSFFDCTLLDFKIIFYPGVTDQISWRLLNDRQVVGQQMEAELFAVDSFGNLNVLTDSVAYFRITDAVDVNVDLECFGDDCRSISYPFYNDNDGNLAYSKFINGKSKIRVSTNQTGEVDFSIAIVQDTWRTNSDVSVLIMEGFPSLEVDDFSSLQNVLNNFHPQHQHLATTKATFIADSAVTYNVILPTETAFRAGSYVPFHLEFFDQFGNIAVSSSGSNFAIPVSVGTQLSNSLDRVFIYSGNENVAADEAEENLTKNRNSAILALENGQSFVSYLFSTSADTITLSFNQPTDCQYSSDLVLTARDHTNCAHLPTFVKKVSFYPATLGQFVMIPQYSLGNQQKLVVEIRCRDDYNNVVTDLDGKSILVNVDAEVGEAWVEPGQKPDVVRGSASVTVHSTKQDFVNMTVRTSEEALLQGYPYVEASMQLNFTWIYVQLQGRHPQLDNFHYPEMPILLKFSEVVQSGFGSVHISSSMDSSYNRDYNCNSSSVIFDHHDMMIVPSDDNPMNLFQPSDELSITLDSDCLLGFHSAPLHTDFVNPNIVSNWKVAQSNRPHLYLHNSQVIYDVGFWRDDPLAQNLERTKVSSWRPNLALTSGAEILLENTSFGGFSSLDVFSEPVVVRTFSNSETNFIDSELYEKHFRPFYVSDTSTDKILKINGGADENNHIISEIGTGEFCQVFSDVPKAEICGDNGLAVDAKLGRATDLVEFTDYFGNLLLVFADEPLKRVRVVSNDYIYTFAGTGESCVTSGDGCGDGLHPFEAKFSKPTALAVNENNDLFIADQVAGKVRVIRNASWPCDHCVIETVLGNGQPCEGESTCGDGGAGVFAQLTTPVRMRAFDGALIVTDYGNHRVRMLLDGNVSTVMGNGIIGIGDNVVEDPLLTKLDRPVGLVYQKSTNLLYVGDYGTNELISMQLPKDIRNCGGQRIPHGYLSEAAQWSIGKIQCDDGYEPARAQVCLPGIFERFDTYIHRGIYAPSQYILGASGFENLKKHSFFCDFDNFELCGQFCLVDCMRIENCEAVEVKRKKNVTDYSCDLWKVGSFQVDGGVEFTYNDWSATFMLRTHDIKVLRHSFWRTHPVTDPKIYSQPSNEIIPEVKAVLAKPACVPSSPPVLLRSAPMHAGINVYYREAMNLELTFDEAVSLQGRFRLVDEIDNEVKDFDAVDISVINRSIFLPVPVLNPSTTYHLLQDGSNVCDMSTPKSCAFFNFSFTTAADLQPTHIDVLSEETVKMTFSTNIYVLSEVEVGIYEVDENSHRKPNACAKFDVDDFLQISVSNDFRSHLTHKNRCYLCPPDGPIS